MDERGKQDSRQTSQFPRENTPFHQTDPRNKFGDFYHPENKHKQRRKYERMDKYPFFKFRIQFSGIAWIVI